MRQIPQRGFFLAQSRPEKLAEINNNEVKLDDRQQGKLPEEITSGDTMEAFLRRVLEHNLRIPAGK